MADLLDLLDRSASDYGERTFAVGAESERTLTFAGLKAESERIAAALAGSYGIRPGDHVAILLPNCVPFLPIYFGILRAGARAVPINARLRAEELTFILTDSETKAIFVHPATWRAAQSALAGLPSIEQRVAVDFPSEKTLPPTLTPLRRLLDDAPAPPPRPRPGAGEVAAIIYTSGTTGRPKGAMLTHGNILFNAESTQAGHGFRPDDVHLLAVPLFHVTGLNTIMPTALKQGAKVVVCAQIDPEDQVGTIERTGCTTMFGVPTTYYLLTNLKGLHVERLKTLRLIAYSGAPMSPETIRRLRSLFPAGVRLHNFFGLTETTSVTTVLPDEQAEQRVESVGRPPPGLELAIFDSEEQPQPPGTVGELVVRGPSVFKGYFKRDEATKEALRGGWFHTGDWAVLDEEGYVFLRGRLKEMIIVAGENVYPIEVENALCAHPAVQEAAVFGREDKALGEVVHAAVVLRSGEAATERDLKRFLMDRLAAFKVPRTIRLLDSLPRNPSGKVLKRDL